MERKLARIRKIDNLIPIENADAIECAVFGGWKVVVKKNEFTIGEKVIYFEIDSWIPENLAPFLTPKNTNAKEYNGIIGNRLRTIKLRGQISQGLVLPLNILENYLEYKTEDDVTEILNIQKWEAPLSVNLDGIAKSTFPNYVPKTDQERIQNLSKEFDKWKKEKLIFEVSEKLEGSSMSVIQFDEKFDVCSRNLSIIENEDNSMWKIVNKYDIKNKLKKLNRNIALQGEIIGVGIQKNIYKLNDIDWYIFDIYDIDNQIYLTSDKRIEICNYLGLNHVPLIFEKFELENQSIDELLSLADGKTKVGNNLNQLREGLVWKCITNPSISFKTVSNQYLSKEK